MKKIGVVFLALAILTQAAYAQSTVTMDIPKSPVQEFEIADVCGRELELFAARNIRRFGRIQTPNIGFGHNGIMAGMYRYSDGTMSERDEKVIELLYDDAASNGKPPKSNEGIYKIVAHSLEDFKISSYRGVRGKGLTQKQRIDLLKEATDMIGSPGTYILYGTPAEKKNFASSQPTGRSDGFIEYLYEFVGANIIDDQVEEDKSRETVAGFGRGYMPFPSAQFDAMSSVFVAPPDLVVAASSGHRTLPQFNPGWPYHFKMRDSKDFRDRTGSGIGAFRLVDLQSNHTLVGNGPDPMSFDPPLVEADGKTWANVVNQDLGDGYYQVQVWDGAGNLTSGVLKLVHRRGKIKVDLRTIGREFSLVTAQHRWDGYTVTVAGIETMTGNSYSKTLPAGRGSASGETAFEDLASGTYTVSATVYKEGPTRRIGRRTIKSRIPVTVSKTVTVSGKGAYVGVNLAPPT